jgi:glycosyltransferase involved in cell wall biosynthesis
MRLAYVSPMPPARTGIAIYSRHLAAALRKRWPVTVFTPTFGPYPLENVPMFDLAVDPAALKRLAEFDRILYQVGNNPAYHLEIWRALTLFPGTVCLHDVVIYYLVAGLGRGALLKELLMEDPDNAFRNLNAIEAALGPEPLVHYRSPSRYPSVRSLLESTRHIIVHNHTSARALQELDFTGRIDVIPLLHYAGTEAGSTPGARTGMRAELGYAHGDFVLGAFGFIGPTKRMDAALDALACVRDRDPQTRARLLVVGIGDPLEPRISELGLGAMVKQVGYVAEERFTPYLEACDAIINLRYPSHGESSATLIQAMSVGKPCVVTNHASFSELPEDTVLKVSYGASEVDDIQRCIEALLADPALGARIGEAARALIQRHHAADVVATRFMEALRSPTSNPISLSTAASSRADVPLCSVDYLGARAKQLVP